MSPFLRRTKAVLFSAAVLLGSLSVSAQTQTEVLTNDQIIQMAKAGLSTSIIVSKIRSSKTNFDVSTNQLIQLKTMRVSDDVINAMVEASNSASTAASRTGAGDMNRTDPNDPRSAHEAGIYLFSDEGEENRMVQLEPSISTQSKSGGFFKSAMTYGIAKIKSKAVLANPNARLQISNPRPVFYFYFEVKNSGLSNSGNVYSGSSTSPNEFVLVKMDQKKNGRELVVGQINVFGAESGTLDKYARAFDYEKISPGVFKVTPRQDLDPGEYGFFYGGSTPIAGYGYFGAGISPKIFDFGIRLPR